MSKLDRTIQLRAQEIAHNSAGPINLTEAIKQAFLERYRDLDSLAGAAAQLGASSLKGVRLRTFDLPEENGQGTLFDIPQWIGISTPEGDLLIPKDQANLGEVRQWTKEGQQHHSTQQLRFKRFGKELDGVEDLPDELGWAEARKTLEARKLEVTE